MSNRAVTVPEGAPILYDEFGCLKLIYPSFRSNAYNLYSDSTLRFPVQVHVSKALPYSAFFSPTSLGVYVEYSKKETQVKGIYHYELTTASRELLKKFFKEQNETI